MTADRESSAQEPQPYYWAQPDADVEDLWTVYMNPNNPQMIIAGLGDGDADRVVAALHRSSGKAAQATKQCTCGQSGHGNAHEPGCPLSSYRPISAQATGGDFSQRRSASARRHAARVSALTAERDKATELSRDNYTLLECAEAELAKAREAAIEECAKVADAHKDRKRAGLSIAYRFASEEAKLEIQAEQRGEDIAAEMIGAAIRALKAPQAGEVGE